MQPHDVWWVCEFCQVRLQGEVRKRLHKTSTFSPCLRNWVKRLKEEVTLLEQAQEQQQEEQQEHIAMIVSSSSSSSSSSSGSGSAAAGSEEDKPMAAVEGGLELVQKKPEGADDDVLVACSYDTDGGESGRGSVTTWPVSLHPPPPRVQLQNPSLPTTRPAVSWVPISLWRCCATKPTRDSSCPSCDATTRL